MGTHSKKTRERALWMREQGVSIRDVADGLGVSDSAVATWFHEADEAAQAEVNAVGQIRREVRQCTAPYIETDAYGSVCNQRFPERIGR
jgi:predicted transcriptional regulator